MEELILKLTNIEMSISGKELFHIKDLTVYQNDRIAIIGKNGSGKSTLLRLLAGELKPEKGRLQRMIDFSYYPQQGVPEEKSELDWELLARMKVPDHEASLLSGGESAKFRLAEVLSTYQPGLLLDEPTTHMDQEGIELLIQELTYYYGTLLFVSHDRWFMDRLATKVWEIDDGQVTEFVGNYSAYEAEKAAQRQAAERSAASYQREKQQLEKAIRQKKEQAEKMAKVSAKQKQRSIKPDRLSSSRQKDTAQKNVQKTAKVLEGRLARLSESSGPRRIQTIDFPKPQSEQLHNPYPIRGEAVTIRMGQRLLLDQADFQLENKRKIAIVGENGAGKTSLLRYIQNHGEGIILSPKVRFASYHQLAYQLTSKDDLMTYLAKYSELPPRVLRSILHNLGFDQMDLTKAVADLSGGEATRLALAKVFVASANVLILDEPTNFIDLATITALQQLIKAYPGMVLFTSHDRQFVTETAEVIYRLQNGKLTEA